LLLFDGSVTEKGEDVFALFVWITEEEDDVVLIGFGGLEMLTTIDFGISGLVCSEIEVLFAEMAEYFIIFLLFMEVEYFGNVELVFDIL
jgi:hypothetical protein